MHVSSDWVLIGTSFFLGVVALFVPYLAELIKRRLFAPSLKIAFAQDAPACHRVFWQTASDLTLHEPVYFFRFQITNQGKSQARLVEAILEELWVYDVAGNPRKLESFSPVNLQYDETGSRNLDINPRRKVYWAFGRISSPTYQEKYERSFRIDVPGRANNTLAFFLEVLGSPSSQANALAPGKYGLKISVYGENAGPESIFLALAWSGKWQDSTVEMFTEIVLTQVSGFQ